MSDNQICFEKHAACHEASTVIPSLFVCPLTLGVMTDPLISKYGHTFERAAILEWLSQGTDASCPITRQPLSPSMLIPNVPLRVQIRSWQHAQGIEVTCLECEQDEDRDASRLLLACSQPNKLTRKSTPTRTNPSRRRQHWTGLIIGKSRNASC